MLIDLRCFYILYAIAVLGKFSKTMMPVSQGKNTSQDFLVRLNNWLVVSTHLKILVKLEHLPQIGMNINNI